METFDLKAAVQRGATWLDTAAPGWHDRIDLDTLEMRSSTLCVGGQGIPEETWRTLHSNGYAYVASRSPGPLEGEATRWLSRDVWNGFTHPDRGEEVNPDVLYPMSDVDTPETWAAIEPDPRIVELKALWVDMITARRLKDALNV